MSAPPRVSAIDVDLIRSAFGALADRRCWVTWRSESRNARPTKVPYSPVRKGLASSTDPETWGTLDDALCAIETLGADGPGVVLGAGLGGVDLDGCRNPETGEVSDWARKVIDGFASYAEVSPTGTGVKVYALGAPSELSASTIVIDAAPANGKRPAIECYVTGRYFAVTGDILDGVPDEIVDAGEPGGAWDHMVRSLGRRADRERELGQATGATEMSDRLLDALEKEAKLKALWLSGKDGGTDRSRNDAAFAAALGVRGFGSADVEAAIRAYPRGQIGQGALEGRDADRQVGRLLGIAAKARERAETPAAGVQLSDFHAYMPMHNYIFAPSREVWPASSVNARIPPIPLLDTDGEAKLDDNGKPEAIKASTWLDQNRAVEQMTWAPGRPMLIEDRLISEGGWIERPGCSTFNLYRPPKIEPGDSKEADFWLSHVSAVYPEDHEHIVLWLAHRVQRPHEKINHALVLGGVQGIGKDTIVHPVGYAIGWWNLIDISPTQMTGRFNGFVRSVILRVSEARDLGDVNRYSFYEHLKVYTAAPPEVIRCDEKNLREYAVLNVCGVVITTNHKTDGMYLPADDRRHYVAWSNRTKEEFPEAYWTELYDWYAAEGNRHVAAYLAQLDISSFNAKAPPRKTDAFWTIVDAGRAPEGGELADVLDALGEPTGDSLVRPEVVTLERLVGHAEGEFREWLTDRNNRRLIPHRMEEAGYVPVRNDTAKDGLWKIGRRRQVVYARQELTIRKRIEAAREFVSRARFA